MSLPILTKLSDMYVLIVHPDTYADFVRRGVYVDSGSTKTIIGLGAARHSADLIILDPQYSEHSVECLTMEAYLRYIDQRKKLSDRISLNKQEAK